MTPERPDPDELLARVERESAKARRGRLKIFFGFAAGVGKTYAMLLAARERRAENADIVVGLVETHGRRETAALLEGFEIIPPRRIDYRGASLREFDLDAALKRKPSIILVDELAHSNASGSRHPKRWQDIEELRDAGIDVYTALNVQHLESLNDDIGQITGVRVHETVPDSVFEGADEVELVDLPPDALLDRLKEGKVYLPAQARQAIQNFFRKGNLIALRELALRQTASQVDAQMLDYREGHAIREIWPVGERVLVCIGPNPRLAERLVRAGKRLAMELRAEWIALYVETPPLQRLPPARRDAVLWNLRLAEQLGAETVTLSAPRLSEAIIGFCNERNVTKIVIGKPQRRGWKRWLLGSVVDTLIGEAHNINLYLLGSPQAEDSQGEPEPARRLGLEPATFAKLGKKPRRYRGYVWAALATLASALLAWLMQGHFQLANLVMVFLLGVVFIAARYGLGPSILASLLGVATLDYLFVDPYYSFSMADTEYLVTLGAMLIVSLLVSNLMANVRSQARVAAHRERRARVLYAMSRELAGSQSEDEIARAATRHIHTEFGGRNVILLPDRFGRIVYPRQKAMNESLRGCDLSVAQWVFDHNEPAGQGAHTLPGAAAVYFPLICDDQALGVLALSPANERRIFLPEQHKLLDTFIRQIALAITRVRLAEQARKARLHRETERLRNSLLSFVSHGLRDPLATIVGSANALVENDATLSASDRRALSDAIHDEARRLSSHVDNILDMVRLDAGAVELNKQWRPLEEIIGKALARLRNRLEGREVKLDLPAGRRMIYADSMLLEQVLANLLENAIRYSPAGSPVQLSAEVSPFAVEIFVADRGAGIPKGAESRLFEKFHRLGRDASPGGGGLELALCRAIVEAHGGAIAARNRDGGGAIFSFMLPCGRQEKPDAEACRG